MSSIGSIIRKRRKELGLTQEELARLSGYNSRSTINKIESGERNPIQSKIPALAEALNLTPNDMLGYDSYNYPELEIGHRIYEALGELTNEEVTQLIRYGRKRKMGKLAE